MMDNKELIAELNRQALRVDGNVHYVCHSAAQALAAADARIAEQGRLLQQAMNELNACKDALAQAEGIAGDVYRDLNKNLIADENFLTLVAAVNAAGGHIEVERRHMIEAGRQTLQMYENTESGGYTLRIAGLDNPSLSDRNRDMDMIERAARALCYVDKDYQWCAMNCAKKGQCVGDLAQLELSQARAVLMAIREPSEGMMDAGRDMLTERGCNPLTGDESECWQAMIDAALNPPQQPTP